MGIEMFEDGRPLSLELYKSLRSEEVAYLEKVPSLWLQKFTLVGAVIAFVVVKHDDLSSVSNGGDTLLVGAVCAVPLLAALLDAKILEYGLHARVISRFLRRHAQQGSVEAQWEGVLWGDDGPTLDRRLVAWRSATTVLVTAVPTILITALCGFVAANLTDRVGLTFTIGGAAIVAYVGVTAACARRVWPSA